MKLPHKFQCEQPLPKSVENRRAYLGTNKWWVKLRQPFHHINSSYLRMKHIRLTTIKSESNTVVHCTNWKHVLHSTNTGTSATLISNVMIKKQRSSLLLYKLYIDIGGSYALLSLDLIAVTERGFWNYPRNRILTKKQKTAAYEIVVIT